MSAISLNNMVSPAASPSAEFCVFQDVHQIARIILYAGARALIPISETLTAKAFTNFGQFALTSNGVEVDGASAVVRALITEQEGFSDFTLTAEGGGPPDAIVLENRWSEPVTFQVTRPNSPFQIVTTVEANGNVPISTVQQWTAYAIINGITTPNVTITNPDAAIVLVQNTDGGFALEVSDSPVG